MELDCEGPMNSACNLLDHTWCQDTAGNVEIGRVFCQRDVDQKNFRCLLEQPAASMRTFALPTDRY